MMNKELKIELCKEAERIIEDTTITYKAQYEDASRWRKYNFRLAVAAALFAAIAGFSAISKYTWGIPIVIGASFLSASLSAILSVLKPSEKSQLHHQAGVNFQRLRDNTRLFKNIILQKDSLSENDVSDKIKLLSDERATLRDESPQPSDWAYGRALKGIEDGQTTYQIDK